jgi:thymidine phosphorylase
VSLALAAATLELLGRDTRSALDEVTGLLDDGSALARLRDLIVAQGGDATVLDDPRGRLPAAPVVREWGPEAGVIDRIACRRLGEIAGALGAGRQRAGDAVDPAVGLEVHVRIGDSVDASGRSGDLPAVRIHARDEGSAERAIGALREAIGTGAAPVGPVPLVHRRIGLP